jgi:hypothetical protein
MVAYNRFIRCRLCNKQLGGMEYLYLGSVIARTELEAGGLYRSGNYEKFKQEDMLGLGGTYETNNK